MEFNTFELAIGLVAIGLGALGLFGMTWGFPLLALLLNRTQARNSARCWDSVDNDSDPSITIVIPAHNEGENIAGTLQSILAAIDQLRSVSTRPVQVIVVANCCSDSTVDICRAFPSVTVLEFNLHANKWEALKYGCGLANSEWIVFADAGIQWPQDLLLKVRKYMARPFVMGVAPCYHNFAAGIMERYSWLLEQHLKSVEGMSGGPISVHGATMMYRTTRLRRAFDLLGTKSWLNDDVVIPLALRSLFPDNSIIYATEVSVFDSSQDTAGAKRKRRVRLVQGNLDWISASFWRSSRHAASILAWRRIFRVGWAFWIICLLIPILTLGWFGLITFAVLVFGLSRSSAFRASLLFPWIVVSRRGVVWK